MTQPLQQQSDLTLQDVEDDLQDHEPLEGFTSREPYALLKVSQQMHFHVPHHHMKPIKHSEVSNGMCPGCYVGLVHGRVNCQEPMGHLLRIPKRIPKAILEALLT